MELSSVLTWAPDRLFETRHRARPRGVSPVRYPDLAIGWPSEHEWPAAAKWVDHLRLEFARTATLESRPIEQPYRGIVLLEARSGPRTWPVAIDYSDRSDVDAHCARRALVYFKMQFRRGGYPERNVRPGGYVPGGLRLYDYLETLRRQRDRRRFRFDVYGRFGLGFGKDVRSRAIEKLEGAGDFGFFGGLGRVRYSRSLREIAAAKVCIDLPGKGDFCFRLVDYLAVGACIVARRHENALPEPLVDGEHVVFVQDDFSDLVDACAYYVHHDEERERLAARIRAYFDAHLHARVLARDYLDEIARLVAERRTEI